MKLSLEKKPGKKPALPLVHRASHLIMEGNHTHQAVSPWYIYAGGSQGHISLPFFSTVLSGVVPLA